MFLPLHEWLSYLAIWFEGALPDDYVGQSFICLDNVATLVWKVFYWDNYRDS